MIFRSNKSPTFSANWVLLIDESADPIERTFALGRLRRLGHIDALVPQAEAWLTNPSPHLRSEALQFLTIFNASDRHLPAAFAILHHDPSWWVRAGAARDLVGRWMFTENTRDEILCHLVQQLEVDDDEDAQMSIYGSLLEVLIPDRDKRPRLPSDTHGWDRARDVDWSLLAPWRHQDPKASPQR